jgi:hypothetical protein
MNKARVSSVIIAGRYVECLMLPSGEFVISVTQCNEVLKFSAQPTDASRSVKRILGNDNSHSRPEKIISELHSQAVSTITLKQFNILLVKLTAAGNETAQEMLLSLSGASLESVVSYAFGIKFTQEETVEFVASRTEHLKNFHPRLTIWFKHDGARDKDYPRLVNEFKAHAFLPAKPVSEYTTEELQLANTAEAQYHVLRKAGMTHEQSLRYL